MRLGVNDPFVERQLEVGPKIEVLHRYFDKNAGARTHSARRYSPVLGVPNQHRFGLTRAEPVGSVTRQIQSVESRKKRLAQVVAAVHVTTRRR